MFLLHTKVGRARLDRQGFDDVKQALRHTSKNSSEAVSHSCSVTVVGEQVAGNGALGQGFGAWWSLPPVQQPLRDVLLGSVTEGPGSTADVLATARTHEFVDDLGLGRSCQLVLGRGCRNSEGRKSDQWFYRGALE